MSSKKKEIIKSSLKKSAGKNQTRNLTIDPKLMNGNDVISDNGSK